jgi:hypothetical protein
MHKSSIILSIFFFFLVVIASGSSSATDKPPIESMLPSPGFSEGWVMEGKATTYREDNLYVYINGEAELYFPYGFEVLGSVLYAKAGDPKIAIVADVYRMGSLLDAFGIYSRYRDPDSEVINIGSEGFVSESQLMFYKDRYFVRLSLSGTVIQDRSVFIACAEAIAKTLPGKSSRPRQLEFLKIPGIISQTEMFIAQSVLGYRFFKKGLTAEATHNGETIRVFIILDESVKASEHTLDQYAQYLKEGGIQPKLNYHNSGTTLVAQDPLYGGVIVRQAGHYLLGIAKLKDPLKGIVLIDRLLSRIEDL